MHPRTSFPFRYLLLTIPAGLGAWAIAQEVAGRGLADKEVIYLREQRGIDLALAEIRLAGADGRISLQEAQAQVDQWLRSDKPRLTAQGWKKHLKAAAKLQDIVHLRDSGSEVQVLRATAAETGGGQEGQDGNQILKLS